MPERQFFRLIRAGHGTHTLLGIDSGLGMAEASFPELAELLDSDCAVRESVPPDYRVDAWLEEIQECGYEVRAVLGYCGGASLACALADRIAELGWSDPGLVLFDPSEVTSGELWHIFLRFVQPFARELGDAQLKSAWEFARETVASHGDDLTALAAALRAGYEPVVRAACEPLELHEDIIHDFLDRYDKELCFLLEAAQHPMSTSHTSASVVLSKDAVMPEMPVRDHIRIDVARPKLMSSPATARATLQLLGNKIFVGSTP